jgi:NADH-quinone oxidoreductase subunit G
LATIYIDNKPYVVEDGQNLLRACLGLGFDLPYFCWHPALHSVGACRQCAVKLFKNAEDTKGRIVMACMTPAAEGTRISIDDPEARAFRAGVIELLMVNHPHDCPVCDEGGECHLQDMTVMTGHTYRRYRFSKRTHRNQDLGPLVNHEMNRCIACYRCVRFYRDYAGGRDLDVFQWHNHVYFGRHSDGTLENEFSGNLVEICPTGVFTDKTLKHHYTRPWDLQTAPSICMHCSVGCNTIPGERYGSLRRIRNRYHHEINGYFLCDRGRFGYEFVNSPRRIRQPMLRSGPGEPPQAVEKQVVLDRIASLLGDGRRVIGIGSPRASLEANFALRSLVGQDHFYRGMSDQECRLVDAAITMLREGCARSPSLHEIEQSDAVLVLGEDLTNTAPMLALAVRQSTLRRETDLTRHLHIHPWDDAAVREALQHERGPLYVATTAFTKLDDVANATYRASPDDLTRFAMAVAGALGADVPRVNDLPDDLASLAQKVADTLSHAERPVIISGTACGSETVMRAAANIAWALCATSRDARLCLVAAECNSFGLGLMGGGSLAEACRTVQEGEADTLIVLENDLFRRADAKSAKSLLQGAKHVIAIDHLEHATTAAARIVLPAATYAEASGTLVNYEGRAQRFFRVFTPSGHVQESWRWVRDLMLARRQPEAVVWDNLDELIAALAAAMPVFMPITEVAPQAAFRIAGQRVPRQPHRYSGRTAMNANVDVNEPQPADDPDSPLSFSMEGFEGQPPPTLVTRFWNPGWNSVQSVTKFQEEVGGPLRGGASGRLLIQPHKDTKPRYFTNLPAAFESRPSEWLLVPLHHIFGSEELSVLSPGIGQLAPVSYLAMHPGDAQRLGVQEEDRIEVYADAVRWRLRVRHLPSLPRGVAGVPVGLPDLHHITLPQWATLTKVAAP